MAEIIEMPKLSDTMEEGAIASWLKKEGEFIEEGEAFVEIETDKATMEYNSPVEGTLLKIIVEAGSSSELNAPICVVGEEGEKFDLEKLKGDSAPEESSSEAAETAAKREDDKKPETETSVSEKDKQDAKEHSGERIFASPLAKKKAAEAGLNLADISGSGPGGRIVVKDVDEAAQSGQGSASSAAGSTQSAPPVRPVPEARSGDEDVPHSMMRKTIAKRLLAGKNDAPHFYLTRSVDMTNLLAWRKKLNAKAGEQVGGETIPKVSVNDLLIQACSKALVKHRQVNASWHDGFIRHHGSVDISVAVAVQDGLITPVIRGAHILGVRQIAEQSKSLITKAKTSSLAPEEYQGGTFSISNLGMMGIEEFTAIINPPQAAILAVGGTIQTPWVNDDGAIVVQPRMKFTLSCDHRVIDGALGAEFLQTLASYLEDPMMMLV